MADVHVKARLSPYSGTKDVQVRFESIAIDLLVFEQRAPVPNEKVPWNVEWADYEPVEYTAEVVLKNPPWADDPDA